MGEILHKAFPILLFCKQGKEINFENRLYIPEKRNLYIQSLLSGEV